MAWQFERARVLILLDWDRWARTIIMLVALDAGADDLVDDDGTWRLTL